MNWVEHPLRPPDFPRPSRCPSGFALRKSLGRRVCTTQYIPPLGSVRIQYYHFNLSGANLVELLGLSGRLLLTSLDCAQVNTVVDYHPPLMANKVINLSLKVIITIMITIITIMITIINRPADVCLPFTVRVGEGVGRYVVATRDIKAGQVAIMATMIMAMVIMDDEDEACG